MTDPQQAVSSNAQKQQEQQVSIPTDLQAIFADKVLVGGKSDVVVLNFLQVEALEPSKAKVASRVYMTPNDAFQLKKSLDDFFEKLKAAAEQQKQNPNHQ